jgi:topoisomerase-4 subunit A
MSESSLRGLFEDNFLEYASYVIKDRAIPDAADGFKPVQRRILWSLHELDDGRFNKVANVIGHCMRYHPHGDQSIGDALVTLANRGYFIDTQGNFGNDITGDQASAPRYIECRLTELARETLFNDRIARFTESYDGRNREPLLLPAKIPVLLLLGAEGIAVGMSTRVLPHNFNELLHAMIGCIRGKSFELFPDFPQGGSIDASGYADGTGKIRNRAAIEKKRGQKKLVIREIPWGCTTESLIASIENAARKGRVRVSSIDDFTSGSVEIELTLSRGGEPDETVKQLYAHTDCEMVYTSNIVVIREGRPVETTVSELLRYSTDLLMDILARELELELGDLSARIRWMTLEQIFIENRVYKRIEEKETYERVLLAVREGMEPFLDGAGVTDDEIEKLLGIRIRRISRFDIESHRKEMGDIRSRILAVREDLADLKRYAVSWLQGILKKYGKKHQRLTRLETFTGIDVKEVSLRNLKVFYDPQAGFVGSGVKGDISFEASEYDRIAVFHGDGNFRILPVAEKHFVDGDVSFCGLQDKERIYTAVYRDRKTRVAFIKRFAVESFILEKDYRFIPEDSDLMLFTVEAGGGIEVWFERKKRMRTHKEDVRIADVLVKGVAARGNRIGAGRPVSSIRYIPSSEEPGPAMDAVSSPGEPALPVNAPADGDSASPEEEDGPAVDPGREPDPAPPPSIEEVMERAEALRLKSQEALKRAGEDPQRDLFEDIGKET